MKKSEKKALRALTMISQVGISMMTPLFVSGWIGMKLDQWFSMSCWFIIFLIMGVLAAFRSLFLLTRQFYSKDLEKEQAEQEYFNSMKRARETKKKE